MQVAGPYGFRPIGILGGEYNTNAVSEYPLTVNNALAISVGDPVAFIAGSIAASNNAPANVLSANTPVGIAWGFSYVDSMGKFWETPYLPAGAVTSLAYTQILVKVVNDPGALMYIQPLGPLPTATPVLGQNVSYKNWGSSGQKNMSTIGLDQTSIAVAATLPLRIIRIDNPADNYPDVVVVWNFGVHAYQIGGTQ